MSASSYIRDLRAKVGTARLLLPSVTALIYDEADRLLLVRQHENGLWSTPGGMIEPDERPADAVVREAWEETGLLVVPRHIAAVFGGPEFLVTYTNQDEVQYLMIFFECEVVGGRLCPDKEEVIQVKYWSLAEAATLPLTSWLKPILSGFYTRSDIAHFEAAKWQPPTD